MPVFVHCGHPIQEPLTVVYAPLPEHIEHSLQLVPSRMLRPWQPPHSAGAPVRVFVKPTRPPLHTPQVVQSLPLSKPEPAQHLHGAPVCLLVPFCCIPLPLHRGQ